MPSPLLEHGKESPREEATRIVGGVGEPGGTGERVHRATERVLGEPEPVSREAQIYALLAPTIRKAVAGGRFTKFQAAAMAKKLGFKDAIIHLFSPDLSIEKAAEFAIAFIEQQKDALLAKPKALEDIGSILLRPEQELRAYLGGIFDLQFDLQHTAPPQPPKGEVRTNEIPTLAKDTDPKAASHGPKEVKIPERFRVPLVDYIRTLELALPQLASRDELGLSHLIVICRLFGVGHLADRKKLDPDINKAVKQVLRAIQKTKEKDVDPNINEYIDRVLDMPTTHPFLSQLEGITDIENLPQRALILGGIASIQKEMLRMLEAESLDIGHVLGVCKLLQISTDRAKILRDTRGFLENLHVHVQPDKPEFQFSFDIQTYHRIMNLLSIDRHSGDLSRFIEKRREDQGELTTEMETSAILEILENARRKSEIIKITLRTLATRLQQTENQIRTKDPKYAEVLKNLRESITKPELVAQSLPRERILHSRTPLSGKLLEHRVRHEQGGKITHSFQLTLKKEELAFQMFTLAGDASLEGLQTYIRDVLYFGHGLLTVEQAKFLLEPLAEAFGEKCKFGLGERLMHRIRESKRTLGLGGKLT